VTDLPGRAELAARVRRFRVEGYELDDLVQEAYVALLDPEGDGNVEAHLNRLKKRNYKRIVKVERKFKARQMDLYLDNAKSRAEGDIDALVLLIGAEQECENNAERWLLNSLATGYSYRDFEQAWNCRPFIARKRVSRFRIKMKDRVLGETTSNQCDGAGGGTHHECPAPGDIGRYDLSGAEVQ